VICDYIRAFKDCFEVEPICRVLSELGIPIAPSTFYEHLRCPVSPAELAAATSWSTYTGRTDGCRGCASCGTPPAGPVMSGAGARSAG
jgi:hypothetical protein